MEILVDENIPLMTAQALRDTGHEVTDIRRTAGVGMSDGALWSKAQSEKCLLITTDKGFAQRRNETHHGILVIRLRLPDRLKIHERVMQAMIQVQSGEWPGLLVMMRDEVQSSWRVS
jgi:predicted nuclease of predicted toxin-antitoxin system